MQKHERWILVLVLAAIMSWGMILPAFGQQEAKPKLTLKDTPGFIIARLAVGTGVENREPVGVAATFPVSTKKVYCFLEATQIAKDSEVSFVWFHGQKEILNVTLPLKMGPRWRTYASKSLGGLKGEWKVEIKDGEGNLVKDVEFKVE